MLKKNLKILNFITIASIIWDILIHTFINKNYFMSICFIGLLIMIVSSLNNYNLLNDLGKELRNSLYLLISLGSLCMLINHIEINRTFFCFSIFIFVVSILLFAKSLIRYKKNG